MNPHYPGGLMPMMMPQQYMMAVRMPAGMPPPNQHGQQIMAGQQLMSASAAGMQGVPATLGQSPTLLPAHHLSASPGAPGAMVAVSTAASSIQTPTMTASPAMMSMTSPIPGSQFTAAMNGTTLASQFPGMLSASPYGMPMSAVSMAGTAGMPGLTTGTSPMAGHVAVHGAQIPGLPAGYPSGTTLASQFPGMLSASPYGMSMAGTAGMTGLTTGTSPMAGHISVHGAQIPGLPAVYTSAGGHVGMTGAHAAQMGAHAAQMAALTPGALQQMAGLTGTQFAGLSAQNVAAYPGAQFAGLGGAGLGAAGLAGYGAAGLAGLQVALPPGFSQMLPSQPSPPSPATTPTDIKKKLQEQLSGLQMSAYGGYIEAQQPQQAPEPADDDSIVMLDDYNSDLHLVIDPDGYGAQPLVDPPGFCFCWAGARSTHGICRGKAYFEVKVIEELAVDFGDDHQETDPHIVRIGWSMNATSFQLGEEPNSFGYGGTGKFSTNCKFNNYGERLKVGDVVGALLDLDSRPPNISYAKNGRWLGVAAPLHGFQIGKQEVALYPHILSKNTRFEVNFGQQAPWFPPAPGFLYIMQYPVSDRVRGLQPPSSKSSCEMIMIIGLPGAGKTTWAINKAKDNIEMRYNVIGTDTLIDKMKVMGLPRKNNFQGRWDVLIDKASKCLNKLFEIGSKKKRHLILDQTNVYPSARRRKMKNFKGFIRRAAVIVPDDMELKRRSDKRTYEDGKYVPEEAVLDMKANFKLPLENDDNFDYIEYVELPREKAVPLVESYNQDGQQKRPQAVRSGAFNRNPTDNRFKPPADIQGTQPPVPQGTPPKPPLPHQLGTHGGPPLPPHGAPQPQPPPPPPPDQQVLFNLRESQEGEPMEKRGRFDQQAGSALDFIKQEYSGEVENTTEQAIAALQHQFHVGQVKAERPWAGGFAGTPFHPQLHTQQFAGHRLVLAGQHVIPVPSGQGILGEYGSQPPAQAPAFAVPTVAGQLGFMGGFNPVVQPPPAAVKVEPPKSTHDPPSTQSQPWTAQNKWQDENKNQGQGHLDRAPEESRGRQNQWQGQSFNQPSSQAQNQPQSQTIKVTRPDSGFGGRETQQKPPTFSNASQYGSQPNSFPSKSNEISASGGFGRERNQPSHGFGGPRFGTQNQGQNRGGQGHFPSDPNQNQFSNFSDQSADDDKGSDSDSVDKRKRERRRPSKWDTPENGKPEADVEGQTLEAEAEVQQDFQSVLANIRSKLATQQDETSAEDVKTESDDDKDKSENEDKMFEEPPPDMPGAPQDSQPEGGQPGGPPTGQLGLPVAPPVRPTGPPGNRNFDGPPPGGPPGANLTGPRADFGPRGPRGPPSGNFERPPFGFRPRGPGMDGPPPFSGRGGRGGFGDRGGRGGPPRPFRPRGENNEGSRGPPGMQGPPPGAGWNPRPGGPPRGFNPRNMGGPGQRGPPFQQGPPGRFQRPPQMGQQRWNRPPR